jgi:hypothetical protein
MNQFIQRIVHYVTNELVVKGLANSKTFQRFAIRTDAQLRKLSETNTYSKVERKLTAYAFTNLIKKITRQALGPLNKFEK